MDDEIRCENEECEELRENYLQLRKEIRKDEKAVEDCMELRKKNKRLREEILRLKEVNMQLLEEKLKVNMGEKKLVRMNQLSDLQRDAVFNQSACEFGMITGVTVAEIYRPVIYI